MIAPDPARALEEAGLGGEGTRDRAARSVA